ncbi:MAG: hypothetical protein K940chlam9_00638 [Chlamydiae bacterium]|nr:hypothetical protein [Chlamydiota bacterium]
MLLIFLDTETTGLDPQKHRALEIAYKIVDPFSGKTLNRFESLVSQTPEVWAEADPASLAVNGFTWEETLEGISEKNVASEIINDFNRMALGEKEGAFICQNPTFDRSFFNQIVPVELQVHYGWPYHWLDLASMFFALTLKRDPKNARCLKESDLSKNAIASSLGLPKEASPHRAMQGVDHLLGCFQKLIL